MTQLTDIANILPDITKISMYKDTKMFEIISNIPYGEAPAICHLWLKWHKLKSGCILAGNNGNDRKLSS